MAFNWNISSPWRVLALIAALSALPLLEAMADVASPDIVCFNGKVVTLDSSTTIAKAVAISGGRFVAVGSDKEVLALAGPRTRKLDLEGRMVLPGLIEGHAHPDAAGVSELEGEIPDVRSIAALLAWVEKEAKSRPKGAWIIHPKMFPTRLAEMRQPTLAELDRVAPDHPVFLDGSYGGVINSAAMKASGITAATDNAGILKDSKGQPNGIIRYTAFPLLKYERTKPLRFRERALALAALLDRYHRVGFTGVTIGSARPEDIRLFQYMRRAGLLKMRTFLNILPDFPIKGQSLDEIRRQVAALGYSTGFGDEWIRIGALKTSLDGGILTGTAYMREPWGTKAREIFGIDDPSYRGLSKLTTDELTRFVEAGAEGGWKMTAHATGGGATDQLLEAFERVNDSVPIAPLRCSVIHGNFFTPDCITRMKKLGVIADVQPAWFYKDADAMLAMLGPDRIKSFNAYRSLVRGGVVVTAGSDHMVKLDDMTAVNPYNPWLAMCAMVTRKTERGSVICPEEALTREEALRCYTINSAFASFEEETKGSIEVGKLADLVVIDRDYFECPAAEIKKIRSVLTMVGGEVVYSALPEVPASE